MSTERPVVNPQRTCSDCGKPVSDRRARRCRACFDKRQRPERGATKVIRVHMETWRRIQLWAKPLEDTPDSVLRRILDAAAARQDE